jgi:hypothetical protein
MSWLQNTLTRRYHVRHRKWGRLFGDRYKARVVKGEEIKSCGVPPQTEEADARANHLSRGW